MIHLLRITFHDVIKLSVLLGPPSGSPDGSFKFQKQTKVIFSYPLGLFWVFKVKSVWVSEKE